jgi:hypothetical protein
MQLTIPYQNMDISVRVDHYQPEVKPLPFGPNDWQNADPGRPMELEFELLSVSGTKPIGDEFNYLMDDHNFEAAIVAAIEEGL